MSTLVLCSKILQNQTHSYNEVQVEVKTSIIENMQTTIYIKKKSILAIMKSINPKLSM